jgi:putative transposase
MSNTTIIPLRQPDMIDDPLIDVLRSGARELLTKAVEAAVAEFLAGHARLRTADGLKRIVRHGHGPERQVQTGIDPVADHHPKVRDRGCDETDGDRNRFSSAILPKWPRRSVSLDALLPILYPRGISTGDL